MTEDKLAQYKCRKCKDSGIVSDDGLQLACAMRGRPIPKLKYYPCYACNPAGHKRVAECYSDFQKQVNELTEEINKLKEAENAERIVWDVRLIVEKKIEELTEELRNYNG